MSILDNEKDDDKEKMISIYQTCWIMLERLKKEVSIFD